MNTPDFDTINQRKAAAKAAEQEYRARRLNTKDTAYWTNAIKASAAIVAPAERPCAYTQWVSVLDAFSREPPFKGKLPKHAANLPARLMDFAADVAQPSWPEPREDLVEFCLAFLEADVMLFRSGYTKRHLVKRLQQSPLTVNQISRIDSLLRRSVMEGTGLEEFRAYRKLAAHLVMKGQLTGLTEWLEEKADGAILTMDRADGPTLALMFEHFREDDIDTKRWSKVRFFGSSEWGLPFPRMSPVVPAGKRVKETREQIKYSAYLMLSSINRVQSPKRNRDNKKPE